MVTALQTYNAITLGDLSEGNNIQGRTFIGGNFTNPNSANFATNLAVPASTTVEVVGNILAGNPLQVQSGVCTSRERPMAASSTTTAAGARFRTRR